MPFMVCLHCTFPYFLVTKKPVLIKCCQGMLHRLFKCVLHPWDLECSAQYQSSYLHSVSSWSCESSCSLFHSSNSHLHVWLTDFIWRVTKNINDQFKTMLIHRLDSDSCTMTLSSIISMHILFTAVHVVTHVQFTLSLSVTTAK